MRQIAVSISVNDATGIGGIPRPRRDEVTVRTQGRFVKPTDGKAVDDGRVVGHVFKSDGTLFDNDELSERASTANQQLRDYIAEGERVLGAIPTTDRIVIERFFDESGGTQMILHAPFGGRVNRAFGLALRKRFCRHFGFELQAAANEDAIVLSLGPHHSFPLEEVFDYLHPRTARDMLTQAVLPTPMFPATSASLPRGATTTRTG